MKKILYLLLAGALLLCCTGCGEKSPTTDPDAEKTTTTTTTATAFTEYKPKDIPPVTTDALVCYDDTLIFKTNQALQTASGNIGVPDATGVPHSDATAADLDGQEAQAILEVLIARQFEVFFLIRSNHNRYDASQTIPDKERYALCTDDRFSCVQDVYDFVSTVYTEEETEYYITLAGESDEESPEQYSISPVYLDYNGKLYYNTNERGIGINYSYYLLHTTHITSRTDTTVTVTMGGDLLEEDDGVADTTYVFTLCKTATGWRLDSEILESID